MNAPVPQPTEAPGEIVPYLEKAASYVRSATTAAEVLDRLAVSKRAYDAAKGAERAAQARHAHDGIVEAIHHATAELLASEGKAKALLADEYDAGQARGEIASHSPGRPKSVPDGNDLPTAAELGISRKLVHDARQIRDAEQADPGIVARAAAEAADAGHMPTRAEIQRAVLRAAELGRNFPGKERKPTSRNPAYSPPSPAGAAWTHVYGICRSFCEWATDENVALALKGKAERDDDQLANVRAVRGCVDRLNKVIGGIDAN